MYKSIGFAAGVCVGLILLAVVFKLANTDRKAKTLYDERQALIRGRGYRFGFYTMILYETAAFLLEFSGISLPFENYLLHIGAVFVGAMALASYCIWKDGYWGINNSRRRYIFVFIMVAALNAVPVIFGVTAGNPWKEYSINILCFAMLLVLAVELAVKAIVDRREEEE